MNEDTFDWFENLDIDALLDVGDQTALPAGEYGPGFGVERTHYTDPEPVRFTAGRPWINAQALMRDSFAAAASLEDAVAQVNTVMRITREDVDALAEQARRIADEMGPARHTMTARFTREEP